MLPVLLPLLVIPFPLTRTHTVFLVLPLLLHTHTHTHTHARTHTHPNPERHAHRNEDGGAIARVVEKTAPWHRESFVTEAVRPQGQGDYTVFRPDKFLTIW